MTEIKLPFERRISDKFYSFVGGSVDFVSVEDVEAANYPYVYVLKDLFTTMNGSWEPNSEPASIPQWARDTYMLRYGLDHTLTTSCGSVHETTPMDLGGDHHINGRVTMWCDDDTFNPPRGLGIAGKTFVIENPALTADNGVIARATKEKQLWMNETMWGGNKYTYYPMGPSDKIVDAKMPGNHHVSVFGCWVAVPRDVFLGWQKPKYDSLDEMLAAVAQEKQVIQFNKSASLQKFMFGAGYVPNSPEFSVTFDNVEYVAQRGEALDTGAVIVAYAPQSNHNDVNWIMA